MRFNIPNKIYGPCLNPDLSKPTIKLLLGQPGEFGHGMGNRYIHSARYVHSSTEAMLLFLNLYLLDTHI